MLVGFELPCRDRLTRLAVEAMRCRVNRVFVKWGHSPRNMRESLCAGLAAPSCGRHQRSFFPPISSLGLECQHEAERPHLLTIGLPLIVGAEPAQQGRVCGTIPTDRRTSEVR